MDPVSLLKTVLDELKQISAQVKELETKRATQIERPYTSAETAKLYESLAKAQSEIRLAHRDSENPYFKSKYANLGSFMDASRPYLAKNGLSVNWRQEITPDGQSIVVCTLAHATGQYIESRHRVIPPKNDIQSIGSYMTYIRRHSYVAVCGLADTDDDGEAAVAESRDTFARGTALNTKYSPKEESHQTISKDQIEEMEYELSEYPDIAEMVLEGLKIQSIADIPKSKYRASITRIRDIKNARNGIKSDPS
jgi:hypothetical protein